MLWHERMIDVAGREIQVEGGDKRKVRDGF